MNVVTTKAELRLAIEKLKATAKLGFVPTMGNLHAGHMALVTRALEFGDKVAVSIFVNPMQFGESEDFADYPRTLKTDLDKLEQAGVELVFVPKMDEIYSRKLAESTKVEVPVISDILCGNTRPGFFVGVATVVAKLFNLIQPDFAIFGRKDFQQLHIIKRMVQELDFAIEILEADTVREADGLAMSSRNNYLSKEQRKLAPALYASLKGVKDALIAKNSIQNIEQTNIKKLENAGFKPDYFVIRDKNTLEEPNLDNDLVVLAAAWLGTTRLIDNVIIERKSFNAN